MSRVLFATWDGGGNVGPAVEIGRELRRRGHEVRFIGQSQQRAELERAGFAFSAYSKPGSWTATGTRSALANVLGFLALLTGKSLGRDVVAEARRTPTDVVVVDCLLYGVLDALSRAGLRQAVLVHSLFAAVDSTMAGGAPGAIARLSGLNPRRLWAGADARVVITLEEFDDLSRVAAPPRLDYTGPVLPDVSVSRDPAAVDRILVSLSTTYVAGQTETLQRILDAIGPLPLHAIVTTGPAVDPADLTAPGNVELHRFIPHAQVMPTVSLVVGHGGHATTMLALAHDLPLVILPVNPAFDQPIIGRRIAELGAGVTLAPTSAAAEIRAAIERAHATPSIQSEASRLGAAIRATHGTASAATLIESLVATVVR